MDAENQLRLLKNEDDEEQFSDFYSYRYFASEGFLPGYSFPRLPLAAYVPGERRRGSYLQRPRFVAIGEFGPGALIYHEGQRYQVTRVQVPARGGSGRRSHLERRVSARAADTGTIGRHTSTAARSAAPSWAGRCPE